MAANSRRMMSGTMVLGVLAACTPELPESARARDLPESVTSSAIPLERAIEEKMVEARALSTHSTRTEMAILLKPLQESQPWIRIDPGWCAHNEEETTAKFVTCHALYVRMPMRKDFTVKMRHIKLHHTRALGMPATAKLTKLTDPRIVDFLRTTGESAIEPDWKVLQVALWALTDDIEYKKVRPPVEVNHYEFKGNKQFVTAAQLIDVVELLEKAGHAKEDFALWNDVTAELERHVISYETLCDKGAVRAFLPFKKVCNFYPMETAADVMIGAFDRHEGKSGRGIRGYAVEVLGSHGGPREIEFLKEKANFETDEDVLASIQTILDKAASATPSK